MRILEGSCFGAILALALYPFGFTATLAVGAAFYLVSLLLRHAAARSIQGRKNLLGIHRTFAVFAWLLVVPQVAMNSDADHPIHGVPDRR